MNGSWKLGKIAGIDIKIHLTFLFIFIWIGFSTLYGGGTVSTMLTNMLLITALFLCVVLHELGHALMAKRFGIGTKDITLLPIGGVARLEKMPEDPKEELLVAAAGPLVNVMIAGLLFSGLLLIGFFSVPTNIFNNLDNFWLQLLVANLILVVFNLIPAFPMDGGRVLRAILASKIDYVKATQIAAIIGRGFAVVMGIAGFFTNPWLILTALFVWSGAGAEAQSVEVKAGLKGLVARDAMMTKYFQVEGNQSLQDVFEISIQTGQQNIPVESNGVFLGIIRRDDLIKAIDRLGNRAPAYAVIGKETEGIDPETPLIDILPHFRSQRVLPVIENRQLLGLITPETVEQTMWLHKKFLNSGGYASNSEKTDTV